MARAPVRFGLDGRLRLPIHPDPARYDEVASGRVDHALRITVPRTAAAHLWPARHHASTRTDPALPPMGHEGLATLGALKGQDFEAVDTSGSVVSTDSGRVRRRAPARGSGRGRVLVHLPAWAEHIEQLR